MRSHKRTLCFVAFSIVSLLVVACGGSDTSDFMGGVSTGTAGSGGADGTAGAQGGPDSGSVMGSSGTSSNGGAPGAGGTNEASGGAGMSATGGSSGVAGGAGAAVTDAGLRSDAPVCACMECAAFSGALAAAPRNATNISNCVIQLHELDCCGARAAYGINHGARTTLCPAEATCTASYPTPAPCTDTTIKTDSGETTKVEANVKLRCVPEVGGATCKCETFVCTNDTCRAAPGIAGGCGQ